MLLLKSEVDLDSDLYRTRRWGEGILSSIYAGWVGKSQFLCVTGESKGLCPVLHGIFFAVWGREVKKLRVSCW